MTWTSKSAPVMAPITLGGWLRVALRGPLLALLVFGGLAVLVFLRLFEWPLTGGRRPVTSNIAPFVSRNSLRILGIAQVLDGEPIRGYGVVVANHSSWLDIFVLNARQHIIFVSKAEVANWPVIGWLARATGTMFVQRERRLAQMQTLQIRARVGQGDHVLFFPEGTSTDGRRVLPFKSTLFAAFSGMDELRIQPVSVVYTAPAGKDERFYGWWGDMEFGAHLLQVLATRPQGHVRTIYHTPLRAGDFAGRKELAYALEMRVRKTFAEFLPNS